MVGSPSVPSWKLQTSFEPKPSLKLDMSAEECQNWERQFKNYYDISNLKHADIDTQRAVLTNCLHPDLQVKIYESLSGMTDIKEGIELIQEEIRRRNPRVVRRHHLFSLEQKKDEYCFSDTVTRMETLAKNADLTDMSKDQILCHLMLRACQDNDLRTKLLEVEEADMTVNRLKDVIQRFEMIQTANNSLNKKEVVRRAATREGNICYRCQEKTNKHQAWNCPVVAKTLFCQICHEAGRTTFTHNSFPTCKAKEQEAEKAKGEKSADSTKPEEKSENPKKQTVKTQRVFTRDLSPAGEPESSGSSDDENVEARRVRVRDECPAGSAHSSSSEEEGEAGEIDSGLAGTESDSSSADSMMAGCNETPSAFGSQKKSSAVSPRGGVTTENFPASQEELRNKLSFCYPKPIYATIIMVLLLLGVGYVNRLHIEEDTTTIVVMLLFGFMIYHNSTVKKSRGKIKDLDHSEKTRKKRKQRNMRVNKLRIKTGEGEVQLDAAPSDGEESEA